MRVMIIGLRKKNDIVVVVYIGEKYTVYCECWKSKAEVDQKKKACEEKRNYYGGKNVSLL